MSEVSSDLSGRGLKSEYADEALRGRTQVALFDSRFRPVYGWHGKYLRVGALPSQGGVLDPVASLKGTTSTQGNRPTPPFLFI